MSYALSSSEYPDVTLKEASRMLRKNGRILVMEHGCSCYSLVRFVESLVGFKRERLVWNSGWYYDTDVLKTVEISNLKIYDQVINFAGRHYMLVLGRKEEEDDNNGKNGKNEHGNGNSKGAYKNNIQTVV